MVEGLEANDLLDGYTHMLTVSFLLLGGDVDVTSAQPLIMTGATRLENLAGSSVAGIESDAPLRIHARMTRTMQSDFASRLNDRFESVIQT